MPRDYNSLNSQQKELILQYKKLKELISETSSNLNSFYDSMRWNCDEISSEDYEKLYEESKIYQIEELDIFSSLLSLSEKLDQLMEDN